MKKKEKIYFKNSMNFLFIEKIGSKEKNVHASNFFNIIKKKIYYK